MWLRTLLLALLILFLARAVMRLMRGIAQGASGAPTRRVKTPPVKMVADPVCGTYVIPGKALSLARGSETHYFCSDSCRQQFSGT